MNKKRMKDYLSQAEQDIWLIIVLATAELEDSLPLISKNLTTEEVKYLKTAKTLIRKSYNSMSERLGEKAIKKLYKYALNCNVEVTYKNKRNLTDKKDVKMKSDTELTLDIDTVLDMACTLTKKTCANCRKRCNECEIFEFLQEIDFAPVEINDNCPYSFNKNKVDKHKKNRHDKKFKNRYEESEDIYTYNIKE